MSRKLALVALVMVTALMTEPSVSLAADADILREARDRAEIEVLMWRYIQALDNLDEEAYPTFFVEDGTLCCENSRVLKGRTEIKTTVQEASKRNAELRAQGKVVPKRYHPFFNSHIEFRDKDHAHVDSYWFGAVADDPPNGAPRINKVGRCEDELVRVKGKWLFKSRNLFP